MVRFSDLLGGNAEPEEPRATAPGDETDPEPAEPEAPAGESPQAVLERLTQYATSARAADPEPVPAPPERTAETEAPETREPAETLESFDTVGDDLLPRRKRRR